jgi:signal transduction histidine kinase
MNPDYSRLGYILFGVVLIRSLLHYYDEPALPRVVLLLAVFGFLHFLEPLISARFNRFPTTYFLLQTAVLLALSLQQPFLDIIQILYIPLSLRLHASEYRHAAAWLAFFTLCLTCTLVLAIGWLQGLAFSLVVMAAWAFLVSYDRLSARIQRDREESERLLSELQQAYYMLQDHAVQADELAAARERNRLARELHDSVSHSIFSIRLTGRTARLLLKRDPNRVAAQLEGLQELSSAALGQLRSLIAQLRLPPQV